MKKIIKTLVIFFSLFTSIAYSGTIDPNTADDKYINFAKEFDCVYEICGVYENDTLFCASSVAIDPNWVLTAAHVVKDAKVCVVHRNNKKHLVYKIILHENFTNQYGRNDIALCYIDEPLELILYPKLYDTEDEIGKLCSICGYGITGNFKIGGKISDGKKRAGSNKIDYVDKDLLICSPSINEKTSLEFLISHGDSGGGLFIENKLAGINSCVIAEDKVPDSTYGDEAGHTRVSKFVPWIVETMKTKKPKVESVLKVDKND